MKEEIHVLLIEDNRVDALVVQKMLEHDEESAYKVTHASSLEAGMRSLAQGFENRLILLDLGLPDETGLKTLRRIIPLARGATVVVITGLQDEEMGIAALREGAHDYLIKGQVNGDQLRRVLRYAVERNKIQRELREEIERRAKAQQALQLSERRYRLLSETVPMGILLADKQGRIVDINKQALRMFGYERQELIGRVIETLLPERLGRSHEESRSNYMNKPKVRHAGVGMDLIACRKDRTEFPVEIALGPLDTEEGVLVSATIVDITERKKLETQLRLSQRMEAIGRLAGGVAHDFNNLLTVILGSAEMALEKLRLDHPDRRKLELIRQAGSSAADLTRQLLAFSRQQLFQPRVLDLKEVVKKIEALLRRLIGENIGLAITLEPSLGYIKADTGQIEQVLINLAVNAHDAMPQGGRITIEGRNVELDECYKGKHQQVVPGQYVMLAVGDTGCGMDDATQSQIFDPFFTTKELGKGTGLGLATVYGIVKQSGGYIWVYSELGKGTIFKIYLPRVEQFAQATKKEDPEATVIRGCETILLAEDSESLREMARECLDSAGYTVLEAASGAEALQKAKDFDGTIHLLLTDVVMPAMSGPELARYMAALRPATKVLFTSGYTSEAIVRQGDLNPAGAFIQKPYRPKALVRKVQEVLGEPAPKVGDPTPSGLQKPINV
jgi:two-component system cell cycle sensor histidine kinase/response regulator CckA